MTSDETDDEIPEDWHEHELVDWDADEEADLEFSLLYDAADVFLRTEESDTAATIESNRGRVYFALHKPHTDHCVEITVEADPDDMEQFGEQLVLAAKAARNGRDGNVR